MKYAVRRVLEKKYTISTLLQNLHADANETN
jgi:hypothetical protein